MKNKNNNEKDEDPKIKDDTLYFVSNRNVICNHKLLAI